MNLKRDWIEDFKHENGKYENKCIECKRKFIGHKRRVLCKACAITEENIKQRHNK